MIIFTSNFFENVKFLSKGSVQLALMNLQDQFRLVYNATVCQHEHFSLIKEFEIVVFNKNF